MVLDIPEESPAEQATTENITEETEATPEGEVDYKAKAEELEAQNAKLLNDLRSKDGQRRRDTDRDEDIRGINDRLGALQKVFTLYMDGMNRGDPEEVQAQISQVNQELAQGQATRDYNARYEKEQARLLSTVQDEDGNLLVNEDDAVKIQTDWQAAWEKATRGDFNDVYDVQIEAARMVTQEERRRADAERKSLRDEAKTAGKKALEKAGIADLDTGAAIAGGNEELSGTALIERGLRMRQNRL